MTVHRVSAGPYTLAKAANIWEVKSGSGMHYGGYQLGWYWDRFEGDEPRGPFVSEDAARRDAASRRERS